MDRSVIEERQYLEKYLTGKLTPPEEKFFEKVMRAKPALTEELGLPDSLRRVMRLLDETESEWREKPPRFWEKPAFPLALGGTIVVLLILLVALYSNRSHLEQEFTELKHEVAGGLLAAPASQRALRVEPARPGTQVPRYVIASADTPTLVELRLNMGGERASLYSVTIKRGDGTFWSRWENLVRDSNQDLRLALNSTALAQGDYDVYVDAVNLRGDGSTVGRLRLVIQ
jgi:hypothetical protein